MTVINETNKVVIDLAVARIQEIEARLAEYGLKVRVGAELEVSATDASGAYIKSPLDVSALSKALEDIDLIKVIEREGLGRKTQTEFITHPGDAVDIAEIIHALQYELPSRALEWGLGSIDLDADLNTNNLLPTNSIHLNISIADNQGRNLLNGRGSSVSKLGQHIMSSMLVMQAQSIALHTPTPLAFKRLTGARRNLLKRAMNAVFNMQTGSIMNTAAPGKIQLRKDGTVSGVFEDAIDFFQNGGGIVYGSLAQKIDRKKGEATRIENRLASASANPYVIVLLSVASVLDAVERSVYFDKANGNKLEIKPFGGPYYKSALEESLGDAQQTFKTSGLARRLLGEELHTILSQEMSPYDAEVKHLESTPESEAAQAIAEALSGVIGTPEPLRRTRIAQEPVFFPRMYA